MHPLSPEEFFDKRKSVPVIDVRSPAEFFEGHIPHAINIPIFEDAQRAIVGTIYKKEGRIPAIEKGLEFVGPKLSFFAKRALESSVSSQILIHCWRGGMRSESMAWLFEKVGITCYTLKGGYKSYRNFLLERIGNINQLIVIEGFTGSGKTEILAHLRNLGEQVIDLEGLANHKGSVFGGIGLSAQPTTQQFQNNLLDEVLKLDNQARVWIEGESQTIGKVFLPDPFWKSMNNAKIVEIEVPRSNRIERLVSEYGNLPSDLIKYSINVIHKRLGEQRTNEILQHYNENQLDKVADKLLDYYDQTYLYSREKYKKKNIHLQLPGGDAKMNASLLLQKVATK